MMSPSITVVLNTRPPSSSQRCHRGTPLLQLCSRAQASSGSVIPIPSAAVEVSCAGTCLHVKCHNRAQAGGSPSGGVVSQLDHPVSAGADE